MSTYGIDTRTFGKPDTFHGEEVKWADWRVILKAYCGVVSLRMVVLMTTQETTEAPMLQATLTDVQGPAVDRGRERRRNGGHLGLEALV